MAAGEGTIRKISPASARSHTRKRNQTSSSLPSPVKILKQIVVFAFIGGLSCMYQATRPPPPKICGSLDGPPITATRIQLSDGRNLAYKEHGVPRERANYKIVYVHGFDSCRHDAVVANSLSLELFEELGLYIVSFDRPGYGESDPNPTGTVKSLALDIEELADQLKLGHKFYVIGFSLGGEMVWGCLKYIPHRLAGVTLMAPVVNYWWSGLPANLSKEAYYQQFTQDQWALRIAHYAPWLTYWWNTQKLFPTSSAIAKSSDVLSHDDKELSTKIPLREHLEGQVRQQGEYWSIHRDLNVAFGSWEFSPIELQNPYPNGEGSVHLWQGDEDLLVPVTLERYIAAQLPWIKYHELPGRGHLFPHADGVSDTIIKTLLLGEKWSSVTPTESQS
ncbi:hypothetical protein QQ045_028471 [Rhodiola kirilowii]